MDESSSNSSNNDRLDSKPRQDYQPASMGTFEARPGHGNGNNGRVKQESSHGEMVWQLEDGAAATHPRPKREEEFDPNPQMEPVLVSKQEEDDKSNVHDDRKPLAIKAEDQTTVAITAKPENIVEDDDLIVPQRIQAYAKLEFPFFNFYIQKLSVTIGRRPPTSRGPSVAAAVKSEEALDDVEPLSLDAPASEVKPSKVEEEDGTKPVVHKKEEESSVKLEETHHSEAGPSTNGRPATVGDFKVEEDKKEPSLPAQAEAVDGNAATALERFAGNKVHVDVDLGPIKAVSRDHARLFFDSDLNPNTGISNGWSLEVRGRNGLVLAGKWRAKGEVVRLANRARIQIAERVFHFVLPNGVPAYSAPPSPSAEDEYYGAIGMQHYDYPPTPERSASPVIYGSDSDELRSDHDNEEERKWQASKRRYPDDPDMNGDQHDDRQDSGGDAEGSGGDGKSKRKRGRPPKVKTAEQLAAEELERQRRNDPSIPRKPRGRPPKQKEESEAPSAFDSADGTPLATQAALPLLPPLPPGGRTLPLHEIPESKLTKKQKAELKKIEREQAKEEKARLKEIEKAEKEAARLAKKEQKSKEDAEKKKNGTKTDKKAAEAKPKAAKAVPPLPPLPATAPYQIQPTPSLTLALPAKGTAKDASSAVTPPVPPTPAQVPKPASPVLVPPPPVKKVVPPKPPAPKAATPAPHFTATNQFQHKPDKPPYSYAALIAQAIYATPSKQASLHHIHAWIPDNYPYFKEHSTLLQNAVKQNLAVNRAFVNIPLSTGVALWALEPEQAKLFDGNTFLPPPTEMKVSIPASRHISPTLPSSSALHAHSPSMSPAPPVQSATPAAASPAPTASGSKIPILISTLPPTYTKPSASASSADMLDPHGFPPIAVHENKMYLSPSIFSTLTSQQLANLQTLETKQALNILQAFVVNYFKVELKKRKKAEKALQQAQAGTNGVKRQAEQSLEGASKVQKVS